MRRNHSLLLHLFWKEGRNPISSSHGRFLLSSAPESHGASSLSGRLPRPWRSEANPLPSGLVTRHLFSRPSQAATRAHFCAAPAVGLKGLVVDGVRALKISFQRRSGFDPKRLLSSHGFPHWRKLMPLANGDGVVFGLIGANVAVFLLWRIADPAFMRKHFMIGNLFGPDFLLKLYLAGALGGSIFYLVHKAFMVPSSKGYRGWDESRIPALGASAAVNAIILLNVFLFPKNIYYINFIIPVPAVLMGAFLIGTDLWRIKQGEGHISGSAHLGGAVVAALVWAGIKKRWI
ncbi:RHOMBOID-like protein 12, mitochondrial isoform X2 [Musa acuminata AAA Group]|uniref:RHOMBOID-like protein 12, mitochondrial isoform X2 n=1 Tax=Musa acuminata AAA Group TaxID=214697 RepID=UPI0031D94E61